jgi:hypothetical protein
LVAGSPSTLPKHRLAKQLPCKLLIEQARIGGFFNPLWQYRFLTNQQDVRATELAWGQMRALVDRDHGSDRSRSACWSRLING